MSTTTTNETFPEKSPIVDAETYEPASAGAIALTDPRSVAAEQFRVLRYRLEGLALRQIRALAFTSAQSGEGKTTTAVNSALTLAKGGNHRVVLVDADLRNPGVAQMMGLRARDGLCDVVAGRVGLNNCLWRFGNDELFVLPAGQVGDDICNTLYDTRLITVLQELRQRFDFVLVDVPPVLPLADAPTLCRALDGAVMVVRANVTAQEVVAAAIDSLVGITVHGLVLNDVDPQLLGGRGLGALSLHFAPRALPPHVEAQEM
jgi:capsular exopolysaccharide synthesis family protein